MRDQDGLQEASNVPWGGLEKVVGMKKMDKNACLGYIYYRYYDRDYIGGYSRDYIEDFWGFIYI